MTDTRSLPLVPALHWGEPPLVAKRPQEPELLLPVGTVTLLLGDIEASSRLWERQSSEMTAALARLDALVTESVGRHGGVRPVEQGEGDSFVAAFARASDAVACALDLQRAPTAPIRLRLGVHTGEVQLRGQGNYIGSTVNRCGRLRDLAHGGQTVVSQVTHDLVADRLPDGAFLRDLGSHRLRDLTRPERVHQLCHAELSNEFPALRSLDALPHNLPVQLTTFVGRRAEVTEVRRLLGETRLLTLTGSGGCGKTRLALQVAAEAAGDHPGGVWFVDLAPVLDGDGLGLAVLRALGLPDEPIRSPLESIAYHLGEERSLLVLDNCEHVVAACARVTEALRRGCAGVIVLATSREPLAAEGECTWRVPSLSLPAQGEPAGLGGLGRAEAVQLFAERARRSRPDFRIDDANAGAVAEICRRLDGIPLAIELAAARVRVLSVDQIVHGLQDRFRLLAGGARTAVPRQQTLRASVDWSHDLLTAPERTLLRRLSVFAGSFDLDAAEMVAAGDGLEQHQVLDQLSLLVDKSLVLTVESGAGTRYRLLETVRQYALEQLEMSGESDALQRRHRDHYLAVAEAAAERFAQPGGEALVGGLDREIDNLRAAFAVSRQRGDAEAALRIASAPFLLWWLGARWNEGAAWLDAALGDAAEAAPGVRAQALSVRAYLGSLTRPDTPTPAAEAVELARLTDDRRLLGRALLAAGRPGMLHAYDDCAPLLREAVEIAREVGDQWTLMDALLQLGIAGSFVSEPGARELIAEGCELARRIEAMVSLRSNSTFLAIPDVFIATDLERARREVEAVLAAARAADDMRSCAPAVSALSIIEPLQGRLEAGRAAAHELRALAEDLGVPPFITFSRFSVGLCALAAGDAEAARREFAAGWALPCWPLFADAMRSWWAEADLYAGDVAGARQRVQEAIARHTRTRARCYLAQSRLVLARVHLAEGDPERAEDIARDALGELWAVGNLTGLADALELSARLAAGQDGHVEAVRLCAAAARVREEAGCPRFAVHDGWYQPCLAGSRDALGDEVFDRVWSEGLAMDRADAVAYARRGRGERRRPSSGWASLTPAELSVARLAADGLANREIAERLFVSPRTVQAHLSHIYTKLDISTRVQLANHVRQRG